MLCFGNFRFAFKKLSEEKNEEKFKKYFNMWCNDSVQEENKIKKRKEPLIPLDKIEKHETWYNGYLSAKSIESDSKKFYKATEEAKQDNGYRDELMEKLDLNKLTDELNKYKLDLKETRIKGKKNTIKYLTWNHLDIYVATSMREKWEFENTYTFIEKVKNKLTGKDPNYKKIRWFDPTQSYCDYNIDKGLVEALMLKRAECTIYMAQEGDTLGKDSELASSLAQGKPVIVYIPEHKDLISEIEISPDFYSKRFLSLLAGGFFDKPDNREKVIGNLKEVYICKKSEELKNEIFPIIFFFKDNYYKERRFQLIGSFDENFVQKHNKKTKEFASILSAIEKVAADNRADLIKKIHPLAIQVNLLDGVANGVLVVRNAKQCADLILDILLKNMKFDLNFEREPLFNIEITYEKELDTGEVTNNFKQKFKENSHPLSETILIKVVIIQEKWYIQDQDTKIRYILIKKGKMINIYRYQPYSTVLVEQTTKSRFRVVTADKCLTNSFWNFYI